MATNYGAAEPLRQPSQSLPIPFAVPCILQLSSSVRLAPWTAQSFCHLVDFLIHAFIFESHWKTCTPTLRFNKISGIKQVDFHTNAFISRTAKL
jgi:hypothetical protein